MNAPRLTDRDLQRLFAARTAGPVDPGLAERISRASRATRQRPRFLVLPGGLGAGPMRALALAATIGASVIVVGGLLAVAGDQTPPPSVAPSGPVVGTASPSPLPTVDPSTSPSPTPSPTASPTTPTPPQPTPTPTPERPAVGGLAFLTRDTDLWSDPTIHATVNEVLAAATTRALVLEGPVTADDRIWWKVLPFSVRGAPAAAHDVGWVVAALVNTDEPAILGYTPACAELPIDLTGATDSPLDRFEGLACYGAEDVEIVGRLTCSVADSEGPSSGPDWLRQPRSCTFDSPEGAPLLSLHGDPVYSLVGGDGQPVTGRFSVTGHFDDPQSSECGGGGREGGPSDEAAQQLCRDRFVVTSARRLD